MSAPVMADLTVFIIRHAEKPGPGIDGPGLTELGVPDDKSLLVRGWQRAGAWAALFGSGLGGAPRPDAVYAADPGDTAGGDDGPSRRPAETIMPLARKLGLAPRLGWKQGDEAALVADVVQQTGTVLVCWEHKRIVSAILPALLPPGTAPKHWPGSRFDVVLRLDRAGGGWTLQQLFPQLLVGDSAVPI